MRWEGSDGDSKASEAFRQCERRFKAVAMDVLEEDTESSTFPTTVSPGL